MLNLECITSLSLLIRREEENNETRSRKSSTEHTGGEVGNPKTYLNQ